MPKVAIFHCRECWTRFELKKCEDPTNSAGACKTCGSRNWVIVDEKNVVIG